MVAQVFNLCMRRLKPAATKNYLMIATWYYSSTNQKLVPLVFHRDRQAHLTQKRGRSATAPDGKFRVGQS